MNPSEEIRLPIPPEMNLEGPPSATESAVRGRPKDPGKRAAICEAARELFMKQGFDASMDAIAEAASVSKATVYSHFGDKESLFREIIAVECQRNRPPDALPPSRLEDFRALLQAFGERLTAFLDRPDVNDLQRLLVSQSARYPRMAQLFFESGPSSTLDALGVLIRHGIAQGYLAIDNPAVASDQLLGMWRGLHCLRSQLGLAVVRSPQQITEHVRSCVDVFLKAYAAPPT